ncbi:MAG: DUF3800 domain-containing protein [Alphaproteobacteria bacterium]|nr:DUF3800 domain-containing protein [Alphaproteobacteria bacterium]
MTYLTPDGRTIREVYVDESSQTKHRYLILGALTLPIAKSTAFLESVATNRLPELPQGEMAWVKVSTTKLPAYLRVVDTFFDLGEAQFHIVVVDTSKLDHRYFNEGSREVGFNKEVYQLVRKCGRLYRSDVFHVYLDERNSPQPAEKLRTILNFGASKSGDKRAWPFRRVQFRDSSKSPILQVADILTGAIAFHLNGHATSAGASNAKLTLSRHILGRARIQNPALDTSVSGKFTIWHRQLRKRPAALDR